MHTDPATTLADSMLAQEARELIRNCVHCGFCLPACPTYRVTGNELDSPRGRIYLIKQAVESGVGTDTAREHLDRCLTCRACETACPSGVQYGRLVDVGRELVQQHSQTVRPAGQRFVRFAVAGIASRRALFTPLVRTVQALAKALPANLQALVPGSRNMAIAQPQTESAKVRWPAPRHARRMAVLAGCVQPGLAPEINRAAARVLDRLGISLIEANAVGCCGALQHHIGQVDAALATVRQNVAASLQLLETPAAGVEAIVSTASGCGVFAKDYAHVLRHDAPAMRAQAARVSAATFDLCEVIDPAALRAEVLRLQASTAQAPGTQASSTAAPGRSPLRVAWQAPCTLQHGQRRATAGKVEALLQAAGCELVAVTNPTLCCGSAGTYSILQPELSRELRTRKLESLTGDRPDAIATANIGCLEHLRQASAVPVRHWIEIVDMVLRSASAT